MKITRFISPLGSAPSRAALGTLLLAALVVGPRSGDAGVAAGSRVRLQSYAIVTVSESDLQNPGSGPALAAAVSVGQAVPPREATSPDGDLHLEFGFWPAAVSRLPEPSGPVPVLAALATLALLRWRRPPRLCRPEDPEGARRLPSVLCLVVLAAAFLGAPLQAVADVPLDLNLQGRLTDEDGAPLSDTETPDIGVGIYASISGGTALYGELHTDVPLHGGIFSVVIGEGTPLTSPLDVDVFAGADRYLEVEVDGDVLEPRLLFNSVPYAFQAENAQTLEGYGSADFSPSGHQHSDVPLSLSGSDSQGVVSATNSYPSGGYGVYGFAAATTGSNSGVYGRTASSSGKGVYGYATAASGTTYGLRGDVVSTAGRGVYGLAGATSGETFGVYGLSKSSEGRGVYGEASSTEVGESCGGYFTAAGTSGTGVYGEASNTGEVANYGGYFTAAGTSGTGVYGEASNTEAGDSYGGYFTAAGASGTGVYAEVTGYGSSAVKAKASGSSLAAVRGEASTTGDGSQHYGGFFEATGRYGRGVYGKASGSDALGVWGYASGSNATGVYGEARSDALVAVEGTAAVPYGDREGITNYGGYFTANGGMGRAVYGSAWDDGDEENYGGYFIANGKMGRGVYGETGGDNSIGIYGKATGINSTGVWGNGGKWDFYAAGTGTNYGPFTGAHEVRFAEDMPGTIRPGMIVSVTGRVEKREKGDGETSLSSTLPTVTLNKKAMDKTVLGVLVSEGPLPENHWYEAHKGERFGVTNALGEGRMWVCDSNGDIEAGDLITSSHIPGYGQRQDDDLVHSYTVGKATETLDWNTVRETVEYDGRQYGVYLIAVVYSSG